VVPSDADAVEESVQKHHDRLSSRLNAGEVHMALRLEAVPDDEWYAFCLPRPHFTFLPNQYLDIAELYTKFLDTKNLLVSTCQKAMCAPLYIASWRSRPLTLAILVWWWLAWTWPLPFLPFAPLWYAFILYLFRQENWNKQVFWHGQIAPLSEDGFALVATWSDTSAMKAWLERLLSTMGRKVVDESKIREFAGLVFRDGRPQMTFQKLVHLLEEQPWIQQGCERFCQEGHVLTYKGHAGSGHWTCSNHGGCQHPLTNKFKSSVSRYRCDTCEIDICEPCVARRGGRPPRWAAVPAKLLPFSLVCLLSKFEEQVDSAYKVINTSFDIFLTIQFSPGQEGVQAARRIYVGCFVTSVVLTVLIWLLRMINADTIGAAYLLSWQFVLILIGTAVLVARTIFMQSLVTYARATMEHQKYQRRREAGGCAMHWAFFTPDACSSSPPAKVVAASLATVRICD